MEHWKVKLPPNVDPPFRVFVNSVPQEPGRDFEVGDGVLLFNRALVKEGKLGFWRWFLGAWGIGTYRRNDTVDIQYELDGRPLVAHALDIEAPPGAQES